MSIGKTMARVAVAAVAVAGVAGMAWAQTLPGTTTGLTGTMSATYSVVQIAEFEVSPNNPTEDNLVIPAGKAIDDALAVTDIVGNLGTIRVKTNSGGWDVRMTTDNGGRMLNKANVSCVEVPTFDGWGNENGTRDSCGVAAATDYLRVANGGSPAPVRLSAAIGVAKQGKALGNVAAPTKLYPLLEDLSGSGAPTFAQPVDVSAKMTNSEVGIGGHLHISFAEEIGGGYDGGGAYDQSGNTYGQGIYGTTVPTTLGTWGSIETGGFPKPGIDGAGVFANVDPLEEYFYVQVGIPNATYLDLAGNKGTYTETFNFELFANF
jgi:hypothetical protein